MRKETVEYIAMLEANASNMPRDDALNLILIALVKQTARIADCLEQQQRAKRGF